MYRGWEGREIGQPSQLRLGAFQGLYHGYGLLLQIVHTRGTDKTTTIILEVVEETSREGECPLYQRQQVSLLKQRLMVTLGARPVSESLFSVMSLSLFSVMSLSESLFSVISLSRSLFSVISLSYVSVNKRHVTLTTIFALLRNLTFVTVTNLDVTI